ncbi:MAG: hypothetical protein ACTTGJ_02215 [Clostridium sp.]
MNTEKRKKYLKEYKKNIKQTTFDLKLDIRKKLDEITKEKNISKMDWITNHIEEDYKNL